MLVQMSELPISLSLDQGALTGSTTVHRTQAEIKSDFGGAWSNMIRSRIESYAIGRFETNSESVSPRHYLRSCSF